MPLEHEEAQPQKDPASTGDQVTSNKGGDTGPRLPPAATPPQPPESPTAQEPAPQQPYKWRRDLKLGIEILGLAALIVYTVFSILQWAQIRYTNRLTARALDGNKETLDLTLGKMQAQIDTANAQYGQSILQTGQAAITANNSGKQAKAMQKMAKSSATSADDAHRALVASTEAHCDMRMAFTGQGLFFTVVSREANPGSPQRELCDVSGTVTVSRYSLPEEHKEVIVSDVPFRDDRVTPSPTAKGRWVPVIGIPVDKLFIERISSGDEFLIAEGKMSYPSGFGKTFESRFCWAVIKGLEYDEIGPPLNSTECVHMGPLVAKIRQGQQKK